MRDIDLFQLALALEEPWQVVESTFDAAARRLELRLDFPTGSRFACPQCRRSGCPVHDTSTKTWRHLDFFQHQAYLTARVPRVICPEHGTHQVQVPWARPESGFTLLFEALVMALVTEMPVKAVADLIGEHDTRVWRIVHHYVDQARAGEDFSGVTTVGADETSFRRGQDYVTVFADLDRRRVVFATPGRDHQTYEKFVAELEAHGGNGKQVEQVSQDMSEAYLKGALKYLPNAEITFDRFHVKAKLSEAIDKIRREEAREQRELLKKTRYLWLRRPSNLTAKQRDWLDELLCQPLRTARAYELMLRFDDAYQLDRQAAEPYLRAWSDAVRDTDLEPLHDFADMVDEYWLGITEWWTSKVSNGLLEGLNSLIQATKRRARGYRSTRNYIAMIYLTCGKLDIAVTHAK
jgi:transposase